MSLHAGRIEYSPRLTKMHEALRHFGARGATTAQLADATGSVAVHSDIAEIRANGIGVLCEFEGTVNGRKRYRYTLASFRHEPGHQFDLLEAHS